MALKQMGRLLTLLVIFGTSLVRLSLSSEETVLSDATPANSPHPGDCPKEGEKLFVHPDYCTKFFQCANGVPVERDCPEGTVFGDTNNVCVHPGSENDKCTPAHPDRECERNTTDLIPHPTRCQGYYNCSDYVKYDFSYLHWSRGYEKECVFPKLFDIRLKACVGYQNVVCGQGRVGAKWMCDYYANQCPVAMCRPCWVDNPSCVGKADGVWPVDYALWSPMYIDCKDERDFKGRQFCPDSELFDPEERKCVHGHRIKASVVERQY